MELLEKKRDILVSNYHVARHAQLDNTTVRVIGVEIEEKAEELRESKIGECIRFGLHEEVKGRVVDGELRKVGPLGFPRGHGTPVCYSEYNTNIRVPTMQGHEREVFIGKDGLGSHVRVGLLPKGLLEWK